MVGPVPLTAASTREEMMSDNVIHGVFERAPEQAGRRREQNERREEQVARLREIENAGTRKAMGKKGHVFGITDRIIAARAVGTLVEQAKRQGISIATIRSSMNGSDRVDRYMLAPSLDEAAARKKGKEALLAKVSGYLAVASAVAQATKQDSDNLKIQVLAQTTLWTRPTSAQADDDPRASHLASELVEMGKSVARRTDLKKAVERARRVPGQWDLATESFRQESHPILNGQGFLEDYAHWTEVPPLPSIPVIRCLHSIFVTPVRLERATRPELLSGEAALEDRFESDVEGGWLEMFREVRLALGPTTSMNEIGMMFESRAFVRLVLHKPEPSFLELWPNVTLKPKDDSWSHVPIAVFQNRVGDRWRRIATTDRVDEAEGRQFTPDGHSLAWPINPLDSKSPTLEHWYISWTAVNEATIAHWLDRPAGSNTALSIRHEGDGADRPVWYAKGSIAHQIENDLATGGLERALEQAVSRVTDALSTHEREWRRQAWSTHERRMANWKRDASSGEQHDAE